MDLTGVRRQCVEKSPMHCPWIVRKFMGSSAHDTMTRSFLLAGIPTSLYMTEVVGLLLQPKF